jgi:acetyl-CoA C-acetyltransferase
MQRAVEPTGANDALGLMLQAARATCVRSGLGHLPRGLISLVLVPKGRWRYGDPGRHIASALGSSGARTVLAEMGVLQQTLIDHACSSIAAGDADAALVVGGEDGHRQLRARILGVEVAERPADGTPDEVWSPANPLVLRSEIDAGLGGMPIGYYAIIESALRSRSGRSPSEHALRLARRYSRLSEIAAANPAAWRRKRLTVSEAADASSMLAFPYTKMHAASWNVDQAGALLFCSLQRATELDLDPTSWIFPLASATSDHLTTLSEREDIARSPGAEFAAQRVLDVAGLVASDLEYVDLYSCFPAAMEMHAAALGLPEEVDWSVTGGMSFAGGPFNNYLIQAICRLAELLKHHRGARGLVSNVSGVLTKHGFSIYSSTPPGERYESLDVTAQTAASVRVHQVADRYEGSGKIQGATVFGGRAVALLDLDDGRRLMAHSDDRAAVACVEAEDPCGRSVEVAGASFSLRSA